MRRLLAASQLEVELLTRKQYDRFYMLAFDARLERDPVQATRDFLENRACWLEPKKFPIPEPLRIIQTRRDTYGAAPLTAEEIGVLSEALSIPTDAVVTTSKKLIADHVRLSEKPCFLFSDLLELFFEALERPKRKGRKSEQNTDRNSVIRSAVERLLKAGLQKFGGDAPACEVVSEELCRLGHPISADGVRKIFDAKPQYSVNEEEIEMVMHSAFAGMSDENIRSRDEAWTRLEELGKKYGYIPSDDLG